MMPNVVRGHRMAGLMTYLVGPGRQNEHIDPHLVAGDPAMMAWHDDNELNRDSALSIARHLDRPRKAFDVDVAGGHVWHTSLSLRAEEGQLTDQQWQEIAEDFIAAMEFDDNQGSKAPCRWVAIRHGLSGEGNDHIHLAVNLVREDGTKARVHNDFKRAQAAARALEVRYGLQPLESDRAERATRGYEPAEREAQARARARAKHERTRRDDRVTPPWEQLSAKDREDRIAAERPARQPREVLALKVRGCATASRTEAEFVRRMRRANLIVRPRYADGRTDVVTGYSVAERPQHGERPIWYGGGTLARDLTLPRMREGWEDTPTAASEAAAEWNAAKRGRRVVAPGREMREHSPQDALEHSRRLHQTVQRLAAVPVEDRETWATVARQTAGALAAWSNATEEAPGELAGAAEALSRSGQTYRGTVPPQKAGLVAISGTAMMMASAARGGRGTVGHAALLRELITLTEAVTKAAEAARDHRHARTALREARDRLERVHASLPAVPSPSGGHDPSLARSTRHARVPGREAAELDPAARRAAELMQAERAGRKDAIVPDRLDKPAAAPSRQVPERGGQER